MPSVQPVALTSVMWQHGSTWGPAIYRLVVQSTWK